MSMNITTRNLSLTSKLGNRLIKFRYGPQRSQQSAAAQAPQGAPRAASQAAQAQGSSEAIWDFQLPARWRRAPISEEEIAVINNGGPL